MLDLKYIGLNIAYALSMASSGLLFKQAWNQQGISWWICFLMGGVLGCGCPLALIYALKLGNANITYALCNGLGFLMLQIGAIVFFHEFLGLWQWLGVVAIGAGIILLQMKVRAI
jgi:drug/metabolite transporter (DMT)-like permease